jgi:hypothetical protein
MGRPNEWRCSNIVCRRQFSTENRLPIAGPPPPISKRETDGAGTMYSLACSGAGGQLAAVGRHLSHGGSDCASGATASAPYPCDTRKIHQLAHHWLAKHTNIWDSEVQSCFTKMLHFCSCKIVGSHTEFMQECWFTDRGYGGLMLNMVIWAAKACEHLFSICHNSMEWANK